VFGKHRSLLADFEMRGRRTTKGTDWAKRVRSAQALRTRNGIEPAIIELIHGTITP
jgi:hypothetical protein